MEKPNFHQIRVLALSGFLAIISGVAMNDISAIQGFCVAMVLPCQFVVVLFSFALFFVFLYLVEKMWSLPLRISAGYNSFVKYPKSGNVRVGWVQDRSRVYLMIHNREWFFRKLDVDISIQYVSPVGGLKGKDTRRYGIFPNGPIEFSFFPISENLSIKRCENGVVCLAEIDKQKNEFCIQADQLDKFCFESGSYLYNLHIKSVTSNKYGILSGLGLIVSYDGLEKITVEIKNELW